MQFLKVKSHNTYDQYLPNRQELKYLPQALLKCTEQNEMRRSSIGIKLGDCILTLLESTASCAEIRRLRLFGSCDYHHMT